MPYEKVLDIGAGKGIDLTIAKNVNIIDLENKLDVSNLSLMLKTDLSKWLS